MPCPQHTCCQVPGEDGAEEHATWGSTIAEASVGGQMPKASWGASQRYARGIRTRPIQSNVVGLNSLFGRTICLSL